MKGTYDAMSGAILLAAMGGTEPWPTGPATHLVQNHAPIVSPRRVAFIPSKADRKQPVPCDFNMYKWRHLAETFFYDLKRFRRVAARYEKTDESFRAMIYAASSDALAPGNEPLHVGATKVENAV